MALASADSARFREGGLILAVEKGLSMPLTGWRPRLDCRLAHRNAMAAIDSPLKDKITPERLLDLRSVLDELVRAKRVGQREAEDLLIAPRTSKQLHMHPLEFIADRELDDPKRPGRKLDIEELTQWLCELSGQPYYRIDPLKVNVNKTTEVMSYAFAQRHNILAVKCSKKRRHRQQPFMRSWEGMLSQRCAAAHQTRRDKSRGSRRATPSSTRWRVGCESIRCGARVSSVTISSNCSNWVE
jgi:hypothetical protein